MESFFYGNPTKIQFGLDAASFIPNFIGTKTDRVMLVYGSRSAKRNGSYDEVSAALSARGIKCWDFGGNKKADYSKAKTAIAICKKENIGCVIGIGGGTCMDMAKIIAFGARNNDLWDFLCGKKCAEGLPHLLIGTVPTFPSGGSVADSSARIYDFSRKKHGELKGVFPDFAILNPKYTFTLINKRTAYAAAESFCQASANFFGGNSPFAEEFTAGTIRIIMANVFTAIHEPDSYDSRSQLLWAAALSTMGPLHFGNSQEWAFSIYSELELITDLMDIAYREAVTVLFPRWLEAHGEIHPQEVCRYMTSVMNINPELEPQQIIKEGVSKLVFYFASLGLPMTYNAYGIPPVMDKIEKHAAVLAKKSELSKEQIVRMYRNCLDR